MPLARKPRPMPLRLESLESREMLSAGGLLGEITANLPAPISAAISGLFPPLPATPVVSHLAANPVLNVSTVPGNGDVNPYGVAFVPQNIAFGGKLHPGDVLVSNFNNSENLQGTGTTIVDISPSGRQSVFFQGTGLGLTTALGVLERGFVLVGNVPTTDGTSNTVGQGSLIILDKNGKEVANLTSATKLDGPWDMTVVDDGSTAMVFVSNVLNGTVTRLDLSVPAFGHNIKVTSETVIASGYTHEPNSAALLLGPTGLAYDAKTDTLYVASTGDNAIYAVPFASNRFLSTGRGFLIYQDNAHLRGPLGLVLAPNGDLIAANGDAVNADPNHPSEAGRIHQDGPFRRPDSGRCDGRRRSVWNRDRATRQRNRIRGRRRRDQFAEGLEVFPVGSRAVFASLRRSTTLTRRASEGRRSRKSRAGLCAHGTKNPRLRVGLVCGGRAACAKCALGVRLEA